MTTKPSRLKIKSTVPEDKRLLSTAEVAQTLGVCPSWVTRRCKPDFDGKFIPFLRLSASATRFRRAHVEAYIAQHFHGADEATATPEIVAA
jgi:predicted DNA-binding transcriptional regulator AlpA